MFIYLNKLKTFVFGLVFLSYILIGLFIFNLNIHNHPHNYSNDCVYVLGSQSFCTMDMWSYIFIWDEMTSFSLSSLYKLVIFIFFSFFIFFNFNLLYIKIIKFFNLLVRNLFFKWSVNVCAP